MNCPYCGTENPEDAKDCLNCSADLTSLPKGTPPPESTAPTMMTSSAEVAAMLAAATAENEPEPEPPAEETPVEATPDFAAPTMMSSSAEIASMLAAAQSTVESAPEAPVDESPVEEPWLEEVPMETPIFDEMLESLADSSGEEPEMEEDEAPVDMPSPVSYASPENFAPTMISDLPDEVAAVIAASKAAGEPEAFEEEISGPVEMEPILEPAAVTMTGIPDPLGSMEPEEKPAPKEEPKPKSTFAETPTPLFNEPLPDFPASVPTPVETSAPDAPKKDNRLMYVLAGCGCLTLLCVCSVIGLMLLLRIQV